MTKKRDVATLKVGNFDYVAVENMSDLPAFIFISVLAPTVLQLPPVGYNNVNATNLSMLLAVFFGFQAWGQSLSLIRVSERLPKSNQNIP